MINLELPQINLILKCDLLNELKKIINFHLIYNFFKNLNNSFQLRYYLDSLNLNLYIWIYCLLWLNYFFFVNLNNPKHLNRTSILADKANGYI